MAWQLPSNQRLGDKLVTSLFYHDIFDYPLTKEELERWQPGKKVSGTKNRVSKVSYHNGFYFLKGRKRIIQERLKRERLSEKKLEKAKEASRVLQKLPTIKVVAVTGSLAMRNAKVGSDIDLMVITAKSALWTTRLAVFLLMRLLGFPLRRAGVKKEKDKFCFNLWMDESNLTIKKQKRNLYTAHELAQIIPLINKDKTYERLLKKNKWFLEYWPKAVKLQGVKPRTRSYFLLEIFEPLAFWLQYLYMKPKMTREEVSRTRAFFHPFDWSQEIVTRLGNIIGGS